MANRPEQMKRPEQREGELVDLASVREARAAHDTSLEQHRVAQERDLILHEALFGAVHEAALENFVGDDEKQPNETKEVSDMWAAKLKAHMESPEHKAALAA